MPAVRNLPSFDHPDVDWAARNMPLLASTMDDVGNALTGLRLGMCLHIEPKTAVLAALLARAGVEVALTGSPGTTRDDVADALRAEGVDVHAARVDDAPRVADVLAHEPDLLLDNGADLTLGLLARGPLPPHFRGGTEETTTGGDLLRGQTRDVPVPVVVINDSPLKLLVENRFGVGQSVVAAFMAATNRMLPGVRATVVGYGPCGRGVAQTLRDLGAVVTVVDIDPYRRLEAVMEGHLVADLRAALPCTRLLFLATGARDVLTAADVPLLGDGVVVAGVSHHPWELDLALLGDPEPRPHGAQTAVHDVYRQPDGRRVVVLARLRMLNLAAGGGNPIEAMDLGLTLQARALARVAAGALPAGVQPVPADLDRRVAEDFVAILASTGSAPRRREDDLGGGVRAGHP